MNNIAILTPEEHYLAHLLLCKIYPNNKKLLFAAVFMTTGSQSKVRNNKLYGWLRRQYATSMSGDNNPNRLYPAIAKAAGEKRRGQKRSAETRERMSQAQRGRTFSDETKKKMSAAALLRPSASNATREKLRISSTGKPGPWAGKSLPTEVRLKMAASRKPQLIDWLSPLANHKAWSKADLIYNQPAQLSISKLLALISLSQSNASTVKRIRAKIHSGWNPLADASWLEFKTRYSKNDLANT